MSGRRCKELRRQHIENHGEAVAKVEVLQRSDFGGFGQYSYRVSNWRRLKKRYLAHRRAGEPAWSFHA